MPAAALGLKKYLSGTLSSSTSRNDEKTPPPLGNSEVSAVQHSPGEVVKPEVGQRRENDGEVPSRSVHSALSISARAGKESGYVLNDDPSSRSNKLVCHPGELEKEAGSLSRFEAGSASGDAEVLAGEPSEDDVDRTASGIDVRARAVPGRSWMKVRSVPVICGWNVIGSNSSDVGVDGGTGEALGEDASSPLVDLALRDNLDSCASESFIEPSDSAE